MGIDPLTLTAVGIALTAASTVTGMIGSAKESRAAAENAAYQAQVAKNNQIVAQRNAQLASEKGEADMTSQGLKNRSVLGAIAAAQAASGVDINTGSALAVRQSAHELAELDALTIRSNASREAYGYNTQGENFASQSKMYKKGAKGAMASIPYDAASSLLGGAASVTGKYLDWQNTGAVMSEPEHVWGIP